MPKELLRRVSFVPHALNIRANEDGTESRTITGTAIVFDEPSVNFSSSEDIEVREYIDKDAITEELLNSSTILMTLYHDRCRILARCDKGNGTLRYSLNERGVDFEFEAPNTADGDTALELVRRGDIGGCSFAFTTPDDTDSSVLRTVERKEDGGKLVTFRVLRISGLYDFSLTPDPAYPQTGVRLLRSLTDAAVKEDNERRELTRKQLREMRSHTAKDRTIY